jgi:hypothetical protein
MRRVAMLLGMVGVIALGLAATPVQAQAQYGWSGIPTRSDMPGANTNGSNGPGRTTDGASITAGIPTRPVTTTADGRKNRDVALSEA